MERSEFLKSLVAIGIAPNLIDSITEDGVEKVILKDQAKKRIAIDVDSLQHIGNKGGIEWTAADVIKLYSETGILLYRKTPRMGPDYNPITVLDA